MSARSGFAMREAVTLTVLAGVGLAVLTPVAALGAGQSRLQVCMSRLKSMGKTSAMFASDNQDRIASQRSFAGQSHWRSLSNTWYSDSGIGQTESAADGAIDAIRVLGKRSDMGRINGWLAPSSYSHLALADYNGEELPSQNYACPEDATLLAWQSDPRNFNNLGVPSPVPPGGLDNAGRRWPYISSYQMPSAAWSNDRFDGSRLMWGFINASMFGTYGQHGAGTTDLGNRRYDEVAFPSAKVHYADRGARHFTPHAVYWNFPDQKQPILFFDGVVRTTRTGEVDAGWDPPALDRPGTHSYQVNFGDSYLSWLPGQPGGGRGSSVFAASYWACTRNGLAGRDLPR